MRFAPDYAVVVAEDQGDGAHGGPGIAGLVTSARLRAAVAEGVEFSSRRGES
ncbi:MAG: hypothetical protein JXP73_07710 [Deltaproteobacteria bacterium]|nr:hypothetical protein [Deltaproteobacteria bacterium]